MSLDNLISQYSFSNNTNEFAIGSKSNDNNVSTNKNVKNYLSSSTNSNNNSDFAEFMKSTQERNKAQKDLYRSSNASESTYSEEVSQTQEDVNISKFYSRETRLNTLADDAVIAQTISSEAPNNPLIKGLDILNSELQALIDQQTGTTETSDTLIQTSSSDTEDGEAESLLDLLSSLIAQINAQQGSEDNDEGTVENIISQIVQSLKQDETADITTVLSGLTTEEITELKEQISDYLSGELNLEEREKLAALVTQHYPLVPAQNYSDTKINGDTLAKNTGETLSSELKDAAIDTDDATQKDLNATHENKDKDRYDSRFDEDKYDTSETKLTGKDYETSFETELKNSSEQQGQTNVDNSDKSSSSTTLSASERFLQTSTTEILSTYLTTGDGQTVQGAESYLTSAQSTNSVTASLANVTTQAQTATQTHPATQMVSMTIQKAVKNGEDTNIKLRLDPPDLGRVEVKMSIDKDNVTKIVLTSEKAETHMMLQRDSDALQKAMSESGLNAEGNLSFELASDDQGSDQKWSSSGNGSGYKTREAGMEDETIIQSNMDWYVDPDTGRMHYNILA